MKKKILPKLGHLRVASSSCAFCLRKFMGRTQITGTVKEQGGGGLVGVNVLVKGTSNGTMTDVNGRIHHWCHVI